MSNKYIHVKRLKDSTDYIMNSRDQHTMII